jgi:predicted nucleic acid-binding protein
MRLVVDTNVVVSAFLFIPILTPAECLRRIGSA